MLGNEIGSRKGNGEGDLSNSTKSTVVRSIFSETSVPSVANFAKSNDHKTVRKYQEINPKKRTP